jgi:hypothetical protein
VVASSPSSTYPKRCSLLMRGSSSPIPLVEALGTRFGNTHHNAARAETTGCAHSFRRAFDSQPRDRLRSAVSCRAPRRCALATRFRQWSVQRPSVQGVAKPAQVQASNLQSTFYESMSGVGKSTGLLCAVAIGSVSGAILFRNASISIADMKSETPATTSPPRKLPVCLLIVPIT